MLNDSLPWLTLGLLGAFHGLNPAMGWLFAVALGLQERSRAAVIRAFGPIALGHAAATAVIIALVGAVQAVIAPTELRILGGIALVAFGLYKLLAPLSHPRWVGMRVNGRELTTWSFLMATAHGAGLMLVPVVIQLAPEPPDHAAHHAHVHDVLVTGATVGLTGTELAVIAVHTAAMFLVMAVIAMVVFEKIGLAILRRAWLNLDQIWAGALIASGVLTLIV